MEALAAVEQESGEAVDGHTAAEDFADDLAIALRLTVEEVSLALRLLALFGFLQAAAFFGCLHLGGIIDGSACHRTSPVCWRAKAARRRSEWREVFCESPKNILLLIRILLCMGRRHWKSPLPVARLLWLGCRRLAARARGAPWKPGENGLWDPGKTRHFCRSGSGGINEMRA